MRFTSLVPLALACVSAAHARIDLPLFSAKQSLENIRFVTADGRFTYSQKRTGALALVTSFKASDVLDNPPGTNYLVSASEARKKMVVEVEKDWHQNLDLTKLNDIMVGTYSGTSFVKVGSGKNPRLHLDDQWLSWFDPQEKSIHLQFLAVNERHYKIRLGKKHNPYYLPDVVMLNPEVVLYTDVNDKGHAALLAFNLVDRRMTVVRKAETSATHMELCRRGNYVALGEFSYEGAHKGSSIQVMAWRDSPSLGGFNTIYRSPDNDIGQLICDESKVWFIKTVSEERRMNTRQTEAATIGLADGRIELKSELNHVSNLVEMDGRVLLPFREAMYVLSGNAGSSTETLKVPDKKVAP